ncbi:hypothetical protein [Fusobacterium nucleatum]|uniref:hypothetical protein n=1 Tax=Fusobacterium nucleatum TaxID=851 RepID=UPI0030CB7C57
MKKEFSFKILDKKLYDLLTKPIRNKTDTITIIIETITYLLIYNCFPKEDIQSYGDIIIKIEKMNRIIYSLENKIYSLGFPFNIQELDNEEYKIYDKECNIEFSNKFISILKDKLKCYFSINDDIDEFYLKFIEADLELDILKEVWQVLKKFILFECGYLRYDYDEEHKNGDIHPLNHYDIYYTNTNTFKIGLDNKIDLEKFVDLLNLNTNCHYFK